MAWPSIQSFYHQVNPFDSGRTYSTDQAAGTTGVSPTYDDGAYPGSMYYDPNSGVVLGTQDGTNWAPVTAEGYGGTAPRSTAQPDARTVARNNFTAGLGSAVNNIRTSGSDAFGSAERDLRGRAEGIFNTFKQGQQAVDRSRENVELNRMAGMDDIINFVRQGLKSGASMLSNKNALGSSAARAIAEAFGSEGNNRARKVSNSAFLENREIDTQQDALDLQKGQGVTDWGRSKDDMVANIGQQVRSQLAELESRAAELGATGPEVEAVRQQIIDAGIGQLNAIDSWLSGQLGGVTRQSSEDTRKNAAELRRGGQAATPFDFGQFGGIQLGGPAIDQLPIYTRNRKES